MPEFVKKSKASNSSTALGDDNHVGEHICNGSVIKEQGDSVYNMNVVRQILDEPELLDIDDPIPVSGSAQALVPRIVSVPNTADVSSNYAPGDAMRDNTVRLCLASAIEMLCNVMNDQSTERKRQAFFVLSEMFVKNGLLPPSFVSDEFHSVRQQYASAIERLLNHVANRLCETSPACCAHPDTQELNNLRTKLRHETITEERELVPSDDCTCTSTPIVDSEPLDSISKTSQRATQTIESSARHSTTDSCETCFSKNYFPSRFGSDFVEQSDIGKGGFGRVIKARHAIDRCCYALKKIEFDYSQSSLCFRVLREIQMLARLCHPNVVRYYGAWFELESATTSENAPQSIKTEDSLLAHKKEQLSDSLRLPAPPNSVSGSDISFIKETGDNFGPETNLTTTGTDNNENKDKSTNAHSNERHANQSLIVAVAARNRTLPERQGSSDEHTHCWPPHMPLVNNFVVYIQMQLGTDTLGSYLEQRSKQMMHKQNLGAFSVVDVQKNQQILYQLLSAVEYIHKSGLIHRDIKPSNIFLHGSAHDQVLLGDFGLACYDEFYNAAATVRYHSSGLGTVTYAAPEQLTSTHYTSSVDIYSIGIVAYEMYRPFVTAMEKVKFLHQLRQGSVDEELQRAFSIEAGLIRQCVNRNPTLRPTAEQLIVGNWLTPTQQLVESLQHTVQTQSSEIQRLRELLRQRNISE